MPDDELAAAFNIKNTKLPVPADRVTPALNRDRACDRRQRLAQCDVIGDGDNVVALSRRAEADSGVRVGLCDVIGQGADGSLSGRG